MTTIHLIQQYFKIQDKEGLIKQRNGCFNIRASITVIYHVRGLRDENHPDVNRFKGKGQHLFMMKALRKVETMESCSSLTRLKLLSKISITHILRLGKKRQSPITTLQQSPWGSSWKYTSLWYKESKEWDKQKCHSFAYDILPREMQQIQVN